MVHGPFHPVVRRPHETVPKLLAAPDLRKTYTEKRRDATEAAELRELQRSGTVRDPLSSNRHSGWPRRATTRSSTALLLRRWLPCREADRRHSTTENEEPSDVRAAV